MPDIQPRGFPRQHTSDFYPLLPVGFHSVLTPLTTCSAEQPSRSRNPPLPTQGRLHCTQLSPHSRFISHSMADRISSLLPTGSPRRMEPLPYAITELPAFLTPSISPKLGVQSQHQKLHRYALYGFLGPSSKPAVPTRILHHRKSFRLSIIL